MRLIAYLTFLFSVAVVMWLMGFESPLMQMYDAQNRTFLDASTIMQRIAASVMAPEGISLLLVGAFAGTIAVLLQGFGAMYIVPMLLLLGVLNFVVFPFSAILSTGLPDIILLPFVLFINLITIFAVITFVRGGG